MPSRRTELLAEVAGYYSTKLAEHGATARGVDWNGEPGQVLRFEQLCRIIDVREPFSIVDLGCGYGALFDFLAQRYGSFSYVGIDIAEDMIRAAVQLHSADPRARFVQGSEAGHGADFAVASGVLNVSLGRTPQEWQDYMQETLDVLAASGRRGFAFNCLTSYSDADKRRPHLFYADPGALFDLCIRRYSRRVALLHDYGLYEFTILVRRIG